MPEWNPYQPPSADVSTPGPVGGSVEGVIVPPRTGWARVTVAALGLCIVVALASLWAQWGQIGVLEGILRGNFDTATAQRSDAQVEQMARLELLGLVVTGICFLVWVAGATRTARSLAPGLVTDTPGSAVGWWFIPFANLYKPYTGMKEIWHASTVRPGAPIDVRPPIYFPLWWTFWILRMVPGYIGISMLTGAGTDARQMITGTQIQMVAGLLDIIAALAAIAVVRSIAGAQARAARSARPA